MDVIATINKKTCRYHSPRGIKRESKPEIAMIPDKPSRQMKAGCGSTSASSLDILRKERRPMPQPRQMKLI
jgi:hypothetical protein